jgi:hypothetical protein
MTYKNNGGPAFPVPPETFAAEFHSHAPGMSLRDYFAAKAMQSIFAGDGATMVANCDGRYNGETNWADVVALNAYEMADAMLKEREKNND